ncbi:hypothetical protein PUMCH_002883 [Australozyma saopauloensis]|uniref:Smr domain-containing protein n=1 Tax=Australozyma saopauloensis TaxID=291208 RepID=A0AAX4HAM7_9ASCO|nr:hypothetical protein PUMCH_002883 [[Candida] saopauloensis]
MSSKEKPKESPNYTNDKVYMENRRKAKYWHKKSKVLQEQLRKYPHDGEISRELDRVDEKVTNINHTAAAFIFEKNNQSNGLSTIDLHGLRTFEAGGYLLRRIAKCHQCQIDYINVIVGRGLHSRSAPALPPVVKDICDQLCLKFDVKKTNAGVMVIDMKHSKPNESVLEELCCFIDLQRVARAAKADGSQQDKNRLGLRLGDSLLSESKEWLDYIKKTIFESEKQTLQSPEFGQGIAKSVSEIESSEHDEPVCGNNEHIRGGDELVPVNTRRPSDNGKLNRVKGGSVRDTKPRDTKPRETNLRGTNLRETKPSRDNKSTAVQSKKSGPGTRKTSRETGKPDCRNGKEARKNDNPAHGKKKDGTNLETPREKRNKIGPKKQGHRNEKNGRSTETQKIPTTSSARTAQQANNEKSADDKEIQEANSANSSSVIDTNPFRCLYLEGESGPDTESEFDLESVGSSNRSSIQILEQINDPAVDQTETALVHVKDKNSPPEICIPPNIFESLILPHRSNAFLESLHNQPWFLCDSEEEADDTGFDVEDSDESEYFLGGYDSDDYTTWGWEKVKNLVPPGTECNERIQVDVLRFSKDTPDGYRDDYETFFLDPSDSEKHGTSDDNDEYSSIPDTQEQYGSRGQKSDPIDFSCGDQNSDSGSLVPEGFAQRFEVLALKPSEIGDFMKAHPGYTFEWHGF